MKDMGNIDVKLGIKNLRNKNEFFFQIKSHYFEKSLKNI